MGILLNIFTVDLWEIFFFDFVDPIKQALTSKNTQELPPELKTAPDDTKQPHKKRRKKEKIR